MTKSRHNLAKDESMESLLKLVQENPVGVSSSEAALKLNLSPRTLLRLANQLMEAGLIQRQGRGPSTRYQLKSKAGKPRVSKSVGYRQEFLEGYLPNKSFFLDETLRESLRLEGQRSGDTSAIETFAVQIYERLLVDLSWSSSKLEGNTYSLLETEKLLKQQQQAQGKDQIETQMILNHKEAVSFVIRDRNKMNLNPLTLRNVHALLSDGLLLNPSDGGRLRQAPIGIEGSVYIPVNSPHQLQEQFDIFVKKALTIKDPFEQSFFVMVFIPYLQPFIDLNKRTSRIACNIPFVKNSLSPLSFNETDRTEYVSALLAVYERTDVKPLMQIFEEAYRHSAQRYRVTKNSLIPPHPLKIKYREFIRSGIAELIKGLKNKAQSLDFRKIDPNERLELQRLMDIEIQSLHEGNFVKFDISPADFEKWAKKFKIKD